MTRFTLGSSPEGTNRSISFLQKVAELRAQGVGDHIALPQLVVCGDQSSGKSSVLEGITNIPFPRNEGVCTKFATEITLTHNPDKEKTITATIIPHASRSDDEKARLSSANWALEDFTELPHVISEVGKIMGLRGFGTNEAGPAFSPDVLSIRVSGPTGYHLTVVDLPGLIAVSNAEQTVEDVRLVEKLVDDYIESSRTIIIAIVQAGNDIANQRIIQKAQQVDINGERTVGVITKPDLINEGTEERIAMLSRNEDTTKLKRGFFIVKNPAPKDLKAGNLEPKERCQLETEFFNSPPWSEQLLDPDRVGISNLGKYMQEILDEHIERELPKVHDDIRQLLSDTGGILALMGPERKSVGEMRVYLTEVSLRFRDICNLGLEGGYDKYDDTFFRDDSLRLRAQIHLFNIEFARKMRLDGAKWKQFADFSDEDNLTTKPAAPVVENTDPAAGSSWVLSVYRRTRGRELQGMYNATFLAELFREQSKPWFRIAKSHLETVSKITSTFVQKALEFVINDEQAQKKLHPELQGRLEKSFSEAKAELQRLWSDERRFPMTYNHYYTDNIQKARQNDMKSAIEGTIREAIVVGHSSRNHNIDYNSVIPRLVNMPVVLDMEAQACQEGTTSLKAYYKVAMKTFVDNVCRQVVERHILVDLPDIFTPVNITQFSDTKVVDLVSESIESRNKRQELQDLRTKLQAGLLTLI
ncbi:hypothetical protein DRE_00192 [Drechslerella stenobrocha 248]|uniref:GED domain-containing protein n=1 Tax=Drechslerella stenobrocha 248 TaxID=1043628 RepID=W7I9W0_9PEZI|nr:hypothetical protein DRE_00192 [Drechslerella stenobrocha 248]